MDKTKLGTTGLLASRIGLGTVKFGRNQGVKYPQGFALPTEEDLHNLMNLAKKLGINLLDTAPAYGHSEERLGRLLQDQRKDWILIGKIGEEFENGESTHIFTPDHFKYSLDRSLKRLNTDYLDALLIHSDGNDLDILNNAPLIKTMQNFKEQGLVKSIGASTKTCAGGLKTLELMDMVMATYTPDYTEEKPVLDMAQKHNKAIILKKVLSSGHNANIEQAMRHAFVHKGVNSLIIGTINPKHLEENVKTANAILSSAA